MTVIALLPSGYFWKGKEDREKRAGFVGVAGLTDSKAQPAASQNYLICTPFQTHFLPGCLPSLPLLVCAHTAAT